MRRYFPDILGFTAQAASAGPGPQIIPVYRQLLADRLTPVSAFQLLGRHDHAFLLESVVGGEKIARFSFIAAAPRLICQVSQGKAVIWQHGKTQREFTTTDPLADLQQLLPRSTYCRDRNLPAFTGGL